MNDMANRPGLDRCPKSPGGICDLSSLGRFEDKSGRVGDIEVLRCKNCGMGITTPPVKDVAFLYDGRESQDFQPGTSGLAHSIKDMAFKRQARALLEQLPERPVSILDFGCGSAQFTRCLSEVAPDIEVLGSDFHDTAPAELDAESYLSMGELDARKGSFDLVTAMHVLEHDDDALGLLGRIAGMAKPGGLVVLEVPNIDCVWTGILGQSWDAWYVPFHRTHFSKPSLEALLRSGGLELLSMRDACVPTMGRSIANALGRDNSLPFLLAGVALHPVQWAGEKLTGRPSAIRVITRTPA